MFDFTVTTRSFVPCFMTILHHRTIITAAANTFTTNVTWLHTMCMRLWNTVLSSSVMRWGKGNSGNLNSYQVALALKNSVDFVRKIAWLQNRTEIKPNNNGKPSLALSIQDQLLSSRGWLCSWWFNLWIDPVHKLSDSCVDARLVLPSTLVAPTH